MYKPTIARESPTRPLIFATTLTLVHNNTPADDWPFAPRSRWQFNNKHGAVLQMYKPRIICVPDGFFNEKVDLLKRELVAKQAYSCHGSYMYLSNKSKLCPILHMLYSIADGLNASLYIRPLANEQVSVTLRSGTILGTRSPIG